MHIHPEWFGAYYEKGTWVLNPQQSTVDSLFETQEETDRYIIRRKAILEELIREVSPERKIIAYRAGAFSIQPGKKILTALSRSGILFDTSVVKGLVGMGPYGAFDYRCAPADLHSWKVSTDVAVEDVNGCIREIPVASVMERRFHQLTLGRLRAKFGQAVPKEKQAETIRQMGIRFDPISMIKFLLSPVPIKLDFDNMSYGLLYKIIKKKGAAQSHGFKAPIVVIGHTK